MPAPLMTLNVDGAAGARAGAGGAVAARGAGGGGVKQERTRGYFRQRSEEDRSGPALVAWHDGFASLVGGAPGDAQRGECQPAVAARGKGTHQRECAEKLWRLSWSARSVKARDCQDLHTDPQFPHPISPISILKSHPIHRQPSGRKPCELLGLESWRRKRPEELDEQQDRDR